MSTDKTVKRRTKAIAATITFDEPWSASRRKMSTDKTVKRRTKAIAATITFDEPWLARWLKLSTDEIVKPKTKGGAVVVTFDDLRSTSRLELKKPTESAKEPINDLEEQVTLSQELPTNSKTFENKSVYDLTVDELKECLKLPAESIVIGEKSSKTITLTDDEADKLWDKISVPQDPNNKYNQNYSLAEAARVLKMNLPTVKEWMEAGKIIGFKYRDNEWLIPKEQIRNGKVAPGLDKLKKFFRNSKVLWIYLTRKKYYQNESVVPLELHFENKLEVAVKKAEEYGMSFS